MWNSVKRGLWRMLCMFAIGFVMVALTEEAPEWLGEIGAPLMRGFGLVFIAFAIGDLALRIMQPYVDPSVAVKQAIKENDIASSIVYLGRCILAAVVLMLIVTASRAETVPVGKQVIQAPVAALAAVDKKK